jgi:hypothetical protein
MRKPAIRLVTYPSPSWYLNSFFACSAVRVPDWPGPYRAVGVGVRCDRAIGCKTGRALFFKSASVASRVQISSSRFLQ